MSNAIFQDKRAVLSGASGVIGYALAQRIIDEGGEVILLGRRPEILEDMVKQLGERASYRIVDVDSDESVGSFVDEIDSVDIIVCTAGWTVNGPVHETPVASAVAMFNARFFGQCRLVSTLIPKLSDGGIILMCSGVGNTSFYPYYAYGAAVAGAVEGFAQHLAGELAPRKIRVNVISPGWTVSDRSDPARAVEAHSQNPEEGMKFVKALDSPMHHIVEPVEFAEALSFIGRSPRFSGQVIRIDAARSITDKPLDGDVDPFSFGRS